MPYNQPIQRRLVAAVTKEYEQRGQVAPQQAPQEQAPVMLPTVFFGYYKEYIGDKPLNPGSRLQVEDFVPDTLSYANAVKQIYRNKIKLAVSPIASTADEDWGDFYALTPAKPNRICQFYSRSNSYYFAHVNAPAPEGYDGGKIQAYYDYVDINGVATNDEENAYAEIRFGTPIFNNYAVAFCRRLVKEVTAEEVIDDLTGGDILDKLDVKSGTAVTSVTPQKTTIDVPVSASVSVSPPAGTIALALSESQQAVQIVTDIQVVDGVLGVQTQGLVASFTGTPTTSTATLTTNSVSVVTDVTSQNENRVKSITAK